MDIKDIVDNFKIKNLKILPFYTKEGSLCLVEIR